jgi:hypothetical protein
MNADARQGRNQVKIPAWIGLALMLSMACWPSLAQEQRPTIRVAGAAADTGPLVLTRPYGPGSDGASVPGDDPIRQSMGCLIGGTSATAIALLAGGRNVMNVIAGGGLVPANPVVLYVGLVGVVFASFCAIGQALTPLYLYYVEGAGEPHSHVAPPIPARDIRPALFR